MKISEVNAFRVAHGLEPITAKADKGKAQRQNANRAARAQASRNLKALRNSNKKG
jgi:hypothetical protein